MQFFIVLQEFVFDGIRSLKLLNLANNRIAMIGLNVFTAEAELTSLTTIGLESNDLTELDPWPFVRGQLIHGSTVSLQRNIIGKFTNRIGWSFRCGMQNHIEMSLNLQDNSFEHVTDLMDGWNITGSRNAVTEYRQLAGMDYNLLLA